MNFSSNADAFVEQNPELHAQLTRFARSIGLTMASAEDTAQDGLIRLHRALGSKKGGAIKNPKAYVFAIVRNDACKQLKKISRYPEVEFTEVHGSDRSASNLLSGNKYDSPELKQAFQQAYIGLEAAERDLIRKRYVEGASYAELGEEMGCSAQNAWKITKKIVSLVLAGKVKNELMKLDPQFATELFN